MKTFNTLDIVSVLLKHKKSILLAIIISGIAAYAASYLIKPLYKSIAVVYPVNLTPNSEESNTEQLIQYFNSEAVKYGVASKQDLYTHYELKKNDKLAKYDLGLLYKNYVSISPTLYESINIEVLDTDPIKAQQIASCIIAQTDSLILALKHKSVKEYIDNYEMRLLVSEKAIDSLKKREQQLRQLYKLMDYREQTKLIGKALVKGEKRIAIQDTILFGMLTMYPELNDVNRRVGIEVEMRDYFRRELDKNKLDYNSKLSFCNVVSSPSLPDKKASPLRLMIVLVSMLSALALASVFFIYISIRKSDVE